MVATVMVFMMVSSIVLYMVFLGFMMISTMMILMIFTMVFLMISSMMILLMNFDRSWNFYKFMLLVNNWLGFNGRTKIWF